MSWGMCRKESLIRFIANIGFLATYSEFKFNLRYIYIVSII